MTEQERAQIELVTKQAADIAGPLAEMLLAAKQADPDASVAEMTGLMVERLLTAGWQMSIFAFAGDRHKAKASYVALLRAVADKVETVDD